MHWVFYIVLLSHEVYSVSGATDQCPALCKCDCDHIDQSNKKLTEIPPGLPPQARQYLNFSHNSISVVPNNTFENMTKLRNFVDLQHNAIHTIGSFAFGGLNKMLIINLTFNNLTEIAPYAFSGIKDLDTLDVRNSKVQAIRMHAFHGSAMISRILLDNNNIVVIEEGAFAGLRDVETITLHNNNIKTIQADAFNGLSNVGTLGLQGLRLTYLAAYTFRNLKSVQELVLADSYIPTIKKDAFSGLVDVELLNLARCKIKDLEDGGGLGLLRKVDTIDLRNNSLRSLSEKTTYRARPTGAWSNIYLTGNPIHCDCHIAWLLLAGGFEDGKLTADASCHAPSSLAGKSLETIKPGDLGPCNVTDTTNKESRGTKTRLEAVFLFIILGMSTGFIF